MSDASFVQRNERDTHQHARHVDYTRWKLAYVMEESSVSCAAERGRDTSLVTGAGSAFGSASETLLSGIDESLVWCRRNHIFVRWLNRLVWSWQSLWRQCGLNQLCRCLYPLPHDLFPGGLGTVRQRAGIDPLHKC